MLTVLRTNQATWNIPGTFLDPAKYNDPNNIKSLPDIPEFLVDYYLEGIDLSRILRSNIKQLSLEFVKDNPRDKIHLIFIESIEFFSDEGYPLINQCCADDWALGLLQGNPIGKKVKHVGHLNLLNGIELILEGSNSTDTHQIMMNGRTLEQSEIGAASISLPSR